ncbi:MULTISPECIES: branched-chain amino acid ABC transporter permease [Butyrivibrio]|jgi:branched-chain amino acid transport system permease protein|uniref:Amino acid/amide ABC transporter membrane protein 1, HAAT family n=1 Tax=Butyrivibrio fibrisolvens TaxID=831 RepID=A0A1H9SVD8_BUTFI|nr:MULTISPECIES: branched-chain amino acid ABC transporter permease [Butyrivibrio]MBQ1457233.1 branched-chain amino acid ABC transporter permease [Butyrivibrio sp.]SEP58865.1 branched-chain amino acid transport system permease protein [Butyrivibrio sp. TB]SER88972.1 amino acid/amide ABC transporter membrane protein 1, HAAT family [Butyrivibrio fibrisolvens]
MNFLTYLISGISLGSVYAIIALGYTMVYGIAKMLNFAHGDFIMVGCYAIFTIVGAFSGSGLGMVIGVIAATVICTAVGVLTERIAYRPLREAGSPLAVLITAIGVSYLLENLALLIFGSDPKSFSSIIKWEGITIASLKIPGVTIVTICVSIIVLVLLQLFIHKTKDGQAMLAASQDRGAATLMGINVNRTISLTFAIGSFLAAIAGALLCSAYPTLNPYTGAMPGIKAFVAAVLGGIGSIPGAMIGGIVLGVIEILGRSYVSSQLSDAIVFAVLIIVLLVKPTGLLGKQIQEKV